MSRKGLLQQLLSVADIMVQGGLSETTRRCGQPTCACQRDPERRHGPHLYLTFRHQGKSSSLYVPPDYAEKVRQAHAAWARFWETGCAIGELNRQRLRRQMQRSKRARARKKGNG